MIKKVIKLVRYWGIMNSVTKAYEKIVIDTKRFHSRTVQAQKEVVYNPPHIPKNKSLEGQQTILYLVHQFYPTYQGGTERFVYQLATSVQEQGHRSVVITLDYEERTQYPYHLDGIDYRAACVGGVEVVAFRYAGTPTGMLYKVIDADNKSLYRFALAMLSTYQPTFVHCAYPQPMASFLKACMYRGIPYGITLTDFNMVCHYATKIDKKGMFCENSKQGVRCKTHCDTCSIRDFGMRYKNAMEMLHQANFVVCPSRFAAQCIKEEFPLVTPYVIPHGMIQTTTTQEELAVDIDSIAYVGKLAPLKGVHLLIQAFIKLEDSRKTLHIYGEGHIGYTKKIRKMIGNNERIILHGKVPSEEVGRVYRQHPIVVVPSLCYETYNYVVREASREGCYVIASNRGALPEAVAQTHYGACFEPTKIESLTQAIDAAPMIHRVQHNNYTTIAQEVAQYTTLYAQ